ncbi:MAG: ExbD/TolR family protein [Thermoguttaceae bacterium]
MRFSRSLHKSQNVKLEMTPMIDVVFLLLAFFVMTFKIVAPEGDFGVRMPQQGSVQATTVPPSESVRVRLVASADGNLADVVVGDLRLGGNLLALRKVAQQLVTETGNADLTAEIDPDPSLRYEHTIAAITALSGYVKDGQIVRLIEKVSIRKPAEQ